MAVAISCIVEGQGDREAVPNLVRRIAQEVTPNLAVTCPEPIRWPKSKLIKEGELERAVELGARKAGSSGAILILFDSDDDCPAVMGPRLLERATKARGDMPIGVVLAKREFEGWFLAAAGSLRGRRGLPVDLESPVDPEALRDPKGWLDSRMQGRGYTETLDQPALAAIFDMREARRADSFDKCYREIARLLTGIPSKGPRPPSGALVKRRRLIDV